MTLHLKVAEPENNSRVWGGIVLGYSIYVPVCENLRDQMPIKQNHFHFVSDDSLVFLLENSGAAQFEFSKIQAIGWASFGGFLSTDLIHCFLALGGREVIHFWISEKGLGALGEGGITLPQIDQKTGMKWEQYYKDRVKQEGKAWKKDLLNRLNSQISKETFARANKA